MFGFSLGGGARNTGNTLFSSCHHRSPASGPMTSLYIPILMLWIIWKMAARKEAVNTLRGTNSCTNIHVLIPSGGGGITWTLMFKQAV